MRPLVPKFSEKRIVGARVATGLKGRDASAGIVIIKLRYNWRRLGVLVDLFSLEIESAHLVRVADDVTDPISRLGGVHHTGVLRQRGLQQAAQKVMEGEDA